MGLLVTHVVTVDPKQHGVLSMAGSFSAISALFGGPLVAGMLLIEAGVGMGTLLIPVLLPGLIAAAIGYLLFIGLGDWGGLDQTALSIPGLPPYDATSVRDLVLAIAIGILPPFSARPCACWDGARSYPSSGSGWLRSS